MSPVVVSSIDLWLCGWDEKGPRLNGSRNDVMAATAFRKQGVCMFSDAFPFTRDVRLHIKVCRL